jgi:hypothetical protein
MQIVLTEVASGLGVSIVHWVEDRVDVGFRIGGSADRRIAGSPDRRIAGSPEPDVIARRLFPLQRLPTSKDRQADALAGQGEW